MLNKRGDERMIYSELVARVNVGDTITWKATDKTHNVEFIKGGIPEGTESYKSKFNVDAEYTFTKPGIYAYKCTAHFTMGMIGFVIVGDNTSNLERIKAVKFPGMAKKVAEAAFSEF
jgi:pseudoazurin